MATMANVKLREADTKPLSIYMWDSWDSGYFCVNYIYTAWNLFAFDPYLSNTLTW